MSTRSAEWNIYRTRFLIRAKQLTGPMSFVDFLGREHCGKAGDYLVESSHGSLYIAPQKIFEDIYVVMGTPALPHNSFFGGTNDQLPITEPVQEATPKNGFYPFVENPATAAVSQRLIASDTIYRDSILTGTTGGSTVAIP